MPKEPEKFKDMIDKKALVEPKALENPKTIPDKYSSIAKKLFSVGGFEKLGSLVENLTIQAGDEILAKDDGDWFDKVTLKRNTAELAKQGKEFHKSAQEFVHLVNRLKAIYEEIGFLLQRYYKL